MDIDNVQESARQVTHDYEIGDLVYVEITGIYCEVYYKKNGPYRMTEVFTNGTFIFQRGQVKQTHKYKTFKT